eukprot:759209-Hanusia_phi.AAC.4
MALGENKKFYVGLLSVAAKIQKNPFQFMLAVWLVMCCGACNKFFTFPMPWIAGQSRCKKEIYNPPFEMNPITSGQYTYTPDAWLQVKSNCTEIAEVFTFVTEKFTLTTANLVFFGITKAIFNFTVGVASDIFGRKWAVVIGWAISLPMPFMVLYANSWWTVAAANIFLGIQQALVWSATIFIMIDYLGQEHSGTAVGINETIGYTAIAVVTEIAAAILDVQHPRRENYYVVIGIIASSVLISTFLLKESKPIAVEEESEITGRSKENIEQSKETSLVWPSGRSSKVEVARSAFIYTSFINMSLVSICFAGLMVNFITGFVWGLFAKWMKDGQADRWKPLSKEVIANIVLCYGLFKGVLQFVFGFIGDRYGRKYIIIFGQLFNVLGLVVFIGTGLDEKDPRVGFFFGSIFLGFGTAMMYANNLAAVCDHSDPSWRSSALGAYR